MEVGGATLKIGRAKVVGGSSGRLRELTDGGIIPLVTSRYRWQSYMVGVLNVSTQLEVFAVPRAGGIIVAVWLMRSSSLACMGFGRVSSSSRSLQ